MFFDKAFGIFTQIFSEKREKFKNKQLKITNQFIFWCKKWFLLISYKPIFKLVQNIKNIENILKKWFFALNMNSVTYKNMKK